jgi:hypothetical protein
MGMLRLPSLAVKPPTIPPRHRGAIGPITVDLGELLVGDDGADVDLQRSAGVQSADRDNPNVFDAHLCGSAGRVLCFVPSDTGE